MAELDLDQSRIARAEARTTEGYEPDVVVLGGERFELPPELDIEFSEAARTGEFVKAFRVLFDGRADEFLGNGVTDADVEEFVDWFVKLRTARSPGESTASGSSSRRTSRKPKPRSRASTTSG